LHEKGRFQKGSEAMPETCRQKKRGRWGTTEYRDPERIGVSATCFSLGGRDGEMAKKMGVPNNHRTKNPNVTK